MRARTRLAAVPLAVAAILVSTASPALADPAEPTNYQSTVLGLTPSTNVAVFEVIGGDSFLQVTVTLGHEVLVPGYFDEPYIRVDADGSVWLNEDSPAYYINFDRYGNADIPDDADGQGEPRWVMVGSNGTYAWHDHRSHWMSPDLPPVVAGNERQVVFPWEIPVVIDGGDTVIRGELYWIPSESPVPGLLAGVIALLPLAFWQRERSGLLAIVVGAAALLSAAVIVTEMLATPAEGRVFPVWIVYAIVALGAAGVALVRSEVQPRLSVRLSLFAALVLLVWALAAMEILWRPIVPTELPVIAARAFTGIVLWGAAGVALLAIVDEVQALRRA
jgi:hypothetical protein